MEVQQFLKLRIPWLLLLLPLVEELLLCIIVTTTVTWQHRPVVKLIKGNVKLIKEGSL
jgi:hypothetical protein